MRSWLHYVSYFLALHLPLLTACGELFQVAYCEYYADSPDCPHSDGGQPPAADLAPSPGSPVPPPPKMRQDPVGFAYAAESPIGLMRQWAGVHQGKQLVFAEPFGTAAKIKRFALVTSTSSKWDLVETPCTACLQSLEDFNIFQDFAATSNSAFYKISLTRGTVSVLNDQMFPTSIVIYTGPIQPFRPFVDPAADNLIFQHISPSDSNQNISGVYSDQESIRISSVSKKNLNPLGYTTYAIGNFENTPPMLTNETFLLFEESSLLGAYGYRLIKNSQGQEEYNTEKFEQLTANINSAINFYNAGSNKFKIRSAFITDLNNDGFKELIFGFANKIYAITYDPTSTEVFHKWANNPIVTLKNDYDRPRSISVANLDSNIFPDLAIEVVDSNHSDSPSRVEFHLNQQK